MILIWYLSQHKEWSFIIVINGEDCVVIFLTFAIVNNSEEEKRSLVVVWYCVKVKIRIPVEHVADGAAATVNALKVKVRQHSY